MKISVVSPGGLVTYAGTIESDGTASASKAKSSTKTSSTDSSDSNIAFEKALNTKTVSADLSTVTSYKDIFLEASEKYGVDYDLLVAMAQQESGFNKDAVSSTGAMGIMQLMPETAEELGVTDPYDVYENIMGGANYIAQKLKEFDGDVDKALAAYNAGSSAVNEYGGVPPYGETQSYVTNIKAIMQRGADVPYTNYVSKDASREDVEADLKSLLSEIPDTEEYSVLRNTIAEMNYL